MKKERNDYGIRNPDGIIRNRFNEQKTSYLNDRRRFVRETPLQGQKEIARQPETFDLTKTAGPTRAASGGTPTVNAATDLQTAADQTIAASSSATTAATSAVEATASASASATATATATAAATGTATGAAAAGAVTAAATGATAVAGAVAATVATAVLVVAVFVSTLAINLSLLISGMTSLVFRVDMTGAQDEDFETPIYATLTNKDGYYAEQQVFRDTLLLTFEGLEPETEYTVTVKKEDKIFFEKTYVTAAEEVERGFLSVWYEGKQIFLSVEVFGLRENERYTINAKDENGNVVFAKDGVELQKDYSFTLDAPRNLFFTLSINADIVAVGELWMESEPEWEYDFASGEWTWEDGFSAASVSFAALDGGDPLILDALVEEQIVSDPDCTTDGVILYTARALWGELEFYDERTLTIPASGHAFGEPEFDWTTDSDGYYIAATATYTCTRDGCGHTETVPADILTEEVAATCEADGYTVFIATAEWNDLTGSDNRSIPGASAFGHEYPEPDPELEVEGVAFDFTQNANGEIVSATMTLTCTRCGQTLTYDADEIELMPTMEYDLCNEGGRAEYFVLWSSDGYEISRYMMVEIGPLGHNYDKPSFAWTTDQDGFYNGATLIAYCPNNGGHEETVTAEVEQTAVDPTCDADGYILYTATAEWNGETYVDEQLIPLTAPGHDYATPTFAWDPADENGNFNSATATFTCIRDGCGHTETVAATISATPHEPGCVETGYTVFTATAELGGVSGSDSVRKTGEEALGHAYPDPTEITPADNAFSYTYGEHGEITAATMTLNCTRCGEPHTFDARSVEMISSNGNLCEDGGDATYRVNWTGDVAYEKDVTVTITPIGHDYGEPTFEWDLNQDGWYDGATAVFVCSHDPTHVVEIEAELEPTAETSATCDVPATTTYTATAEWNGGTYTDERVVVWEFSTLGHQFGNLNENEPDESAFSYSYNDNGEIVDATMTLTCTRCGEPVTMHASRIALMSSEDDLCEEGGNAEYSILWSDGFELEYTRYEFATVGPLGHEYGSPYFDWDEGGDNTYLGATAVFECQRCGNNHEIRIEATMESVEHEASCVYDAYTVYTVTVERDGETYTDQRTVDQSGTAFGHEYPEPDPENDVDGVSYSYDRNDAGEIIGATMTRICAHCGNVETLYAAEIQPMDDVNLCEGGDVEYYLFWNDDMEFAKYVTVTITPQGHDYDLEDPVFDWYEDGDGYAANLLLTCTRNSEHMETVPATVTDEGDYYLATAEYGGETFTDQRQKN